MKEITGPGIQKEKYSLDEGIKLEVKSMEDNGNWAMSSISILSSRNTGNHFPTHGAGRDVAVSLLE